MATTIVGDAVKTNEKPEGAVAEAPFIALPAHSSATSSRPAGRTFFLHAMNPRHLARTFVRYLWREWVRPLALPLLLIASAKSAIADINYVPSGSMKPTILGG